MDNIIGKLTVYFENPFWIGVFERTEKGKLSVAKITFGAKPKDQEVYGFILKYYYSLKFSPSVTTAVKEKKRNPKRIQREIKRQLHNTGIGTKSQQALKIQQEQNKYERKTRFVEQKQTEKRRIFELKQQKRKEKHRGR